MSRSIDSAKLALWRERFSRFSRDEVSVESFCNREQVSVAAFYYWREKVRESRRSSQGRPYANRPGVFQPVTVVPAVAAVRIALPCGTRIEVGAEDLEVVRAVVDVVARSSDDGRGSAEAC